MPTPTITKLAIIEAVSQDLKLRWRGTATAAAGTTMTVPEIADIFSEALAPLAAYIAPVGNTGHRRIADFDASTGIVTTNRAHGFTPTAMDVWLILTPLDWREIVDDALAALYFTDRVSINPAVGQSLYPTGADWLQRRQQVEGLYYHIVTGNVIDEKPVPSYSLIQDADSVSININVIPTDVSGLTFVVEARHFYEPLASDTDTTTCPAPLVKAQTKLEAMRRVWTVMGEREAKMLFESELRETERELLDKKKQFISQTQTSPLHVERPQPGPETAMTGNYRW